MNFDETLMKRLKYLEREVDRLKVWEKPDNTGWIPVSSTWTYASATTITVPSGAAAIYSVGDKIKLNNTDLKYFYIVGVADTVLTITGGSDYTLDSDAISAVYYSKAATPLGFSYGGKVFIPLAAPLSSTSWDGDAYSTTAKTLIDLSSAFGVPANIKAVLLAVTIADSASAAGDCWLCLSPNNTSGQGLFIRCSGLPDGKNTNQNYIVPCDANGDIYYQTVTSGAGSMPIYIRVWGYWL